MERLLLKEFSIIFQKDLNHLLSNTMVSVTHIHISPDFSFAKCYVSFFGKHSHEEGISILLSHKKEIRKLLGKNIKNQFKKIPEIHFYPDDSLDTAIEIQNILSKD